MVGSGLGSGLGTTGFRGPRAVILSVASRSVFVSVLRSGFFSSFGGGDGGLVSAAGSFGGAGGGGGGAGLDSVFGGADTVVTRPVWVRMGDRSSAGLGSGAFSAAGFGGSTLGSFFEESGMVPAVFGTR